MVAGYLAVGPVSWRDARYSGGGHELGAQLGDHVGEARAGLGPVPGAAQPAVVDVGGGISGDRVPHDNQGLHEERERDGALDGALGTAVRIPGAGELLAGGVGRLDRPPPGVALDQPGWGGGCVEAEDAQVAGLVRAGLTGGTRQPGACLKLPYHRQSAVAACSVTSWP